MPHLRERWRTTVPGDASHCIRCHPESGSVFVGDGWGVPYAALRLHRLDLETGEEIASVRTRHQGVSALAPAIDHLYAATDSRLFELGLETLAVRREWDRNLVRYTQQLVPAGDRVVMANWLNRTIGILDPATGRTRRVSAGLQPILFGHRRAVKVLTGFEGGLCVLDLGSARLLKCEPTPPIWKVATGQEVWAVLAGPPTDGQGAPPVWRRMGTQRLAKIGDSQWGAQLPEACWDLACDDPRGLLWCLLGRPNQRRHTQDTLMAVSQHLGTVVGAFSPPANCVFTHVDAVANVALAVEAHPVLKGNVKVNATATLICLELVDP